MVLLPVVLALVSPQDGPNTMHVLMGKGKLVYLSITSTDYPQRLVLPSSGDDERPSLLGEVRALVEGDVREEALTCGPQGLGRSARQGLKKILARFNKLDELDAVTRVRGRLDEVKASMADNIDLALKSLDKTSEVEQTSEELRSSAQAFKRSAGRVERAMRWKAFVMGLVVFLVVAGIITAIVELQGHQVDAGGRSRAAEPPAVVPADTLAGGCV